MLPFKEIFTGTNGSISSKRVIGTICIFYSMLLVGTALVISPQSDIPANVLSASKEFLLVGAGMISAGLFEKRQV